MTEGNKIRVLVIDDSAYNRQTITALLQQLPEIEVVARAGDGEEGLRLAFQYQPDVITLDLEMPKMDGFAFLRLLMAKQPTPVIVVSGFASRENIFRALELGALDFVAKPQRAVSSELLNIKDELLHKVQLVTKLRMLSLTDRADRVRRMGTMSSAMKLLPVPLDKGPPARKEGPRPKAVIALGASTGGPPALSQILANLDPSLPVGLVITQHMPAKFTKAFAERLDRTTPWRVLEAESGDVVSPGLALVAPGSGSLLVRRDALPGGGYRVEVRPPNPEDRFVPSVDRMLESVAKACGADALAVVLTGMGGDGGKGVKDIKAAGGRVIAEAPETAVIFGMPEEAIRTGAVDEVVPLHGMCDAIARFARSKS